MAPGVIAGDMRPRLGLRRSEMRIYTGPVTVLPLEHTRTNRRSSGGVVEGLNNTSKLSMLESHWFRTFHITEIALFQYLGSAAK